MKGATKRRLVLGLVLAVAAIAIGIAYWRHQVPAIHQDHDHGLTNLDGGGFLWIEEGRGERRNLVGRPDRVLVLHWMTPDSAAALAELPAFLRFAEDVADEPAIEIVLVLEAPDWETAEAWAASHGVPGSLLHLDPGGETGKLIGVRRIPETFVYDPAGHLGHQARGPLAWDSLEVREMIRRLEAGVTDHID